MSTTSSHKTVTLGPPVAALPEPGSRVHYQPAPYWEAVANGCRKHPGQWLPVYIAGLSAGTLKGAVGPIKTGKYASFRTGRWDAVHRDGTLYVSYLGETIDQPVTALKAV